MPQAPTLRRGSAQPQVWQQDRSKLESCINQQAETERKATDETEYRQVATLRQHSPDLQCEGGSFYIGGRPSKIQSNPPCLLLLFYYIYLSLLVSSLPVAPADRPPESVPRTAWV